MRQMRSAGSEISAGIHVFIILKRGCSSGSYDEPYGSRFF